jgi:hypothetical protein
MSSEIALSRVIAVPASMEAARDRPMPPVQPYPADRAPDKVAPVARPNPTLRLDPELEIVVLEFRDDNGRVRNTIPTEQQLAAYRTWDRTQTGEPPRGRHGGSGGEAERDALAATPRADAADPAARQTARPVEAAGPPPDSGAAPPVNDSTTERR